MSDEQRTEDEAEVEAHHRKKDANSEPQDEATSEDDFEAHRHKKD
jgi:hypothetical protein